MKLRFMRCLKVRCTDLVVHVFFPLGILIIVICDKCTRKIFEINIISEIIFAETSKQVSVIGFPHGRLIFIDYHHFNHIICQEID